jgi:nucleoside-diphosphate-sugar epimerase
MRRSWRLLVQLIALAKEKGFVGYPGDGANLGNAVHVLDVASLFRMALEKGPAGNADADRFAPLVVDLGGQAQLLLVGCVFSTTLQNSPANDRARPSRAT